MDQIAKALTARQTDQAEPDERLSRADFKQDRSEPSPSATGMPLNCSATGTAGAGRMPLIAALLVLTAAGMTCAHLGRVPFAVLGLIGNGATSLPPLPASPD